MKREISLDELKRIQVEILDQVHSFCKNNEITYYLSSGSLIGAIRHKGYIPWDDDIDIYMPRLDYERFLSIYKDDSNSYRVRSLRTDASYSLAYAKVERVGTKLIERVDNPLDIGVNIDIFPVDGVPDDLTQRKKYFSKIQSIRNRMIFKDVSLSFRHRGLLKNIVLLLGKVCLLNRSLRSLAEDLDAMIDKSLNDSNFVCNLVMGNGINSIFRRESLGGIIQVEFEGKRYDTMLGYDDYLTKTYGDYMKLPPTALRVSHHSFYAYWM